MTARADRVTGAQADLLARLMESSAFTEAEKEAVKREMFGAYPMTKERATKLIDRALKVLKTRKAGSGREPDARETAAAAGPSSDPPAKGEG